MRMHRTAQLAAKNHTASLDSLAKPPKKKSYNSLRDQDLPYLTAGEFIYLAMSKKHIKMKLNFSGEILTPFLYKRVALPSR